MRGKQNSTRGRYRILYEVRALGEFAGASAGYSARSGMFGAAERVLADRRIYKTR